MNLKHAPRATDFVARSLNATQSDSGDGLLPAFYIGRVTTITDPEKQNRIKARFQWQEEGEESAWLSEFTLFSGPTDLARNRIFGFDKPLPEVGSLVGIFFNGGDPHDGWYFGAPRFQEGKYGCPRVEKDKFLDRSMRVALQNGFEFGVDSDGNTYMVVPGNLRIKIQCAAHISSRGPMTFLTKKLRHVAYSVLRLIGVTIDQTNYPRPDEAAELREMAIDAFDGPPGREDPGIPKILDLGDS